MSDFFPHSQVPGLDHFDLPEGFLALADSLSEDEFFEIDDETLSEILSDSRSGPEGIDMM